MARREIHIDYHWFLILFSKALGALVILFIIVPKLTGDVQNKLKELEQLQELKKEVVVMDSLMQVLKSSIPENVYKSLEEKVKSFKNTTNALEVQIKDLQNALAKNDNQREYYLNEYNRLKEELKKSEVIVKDHDMIVSNLNDEKEKIKNQLEVLQKQIKDCDELRKALENKSSLESQIVVLQKNVESDLLKIKDMEDAITKYKQVLTEKDQKIKEDEKEIDKLEKQLAQCEPIKKAGLEIKDKNVVFIVDCSGSMDDAPEADKLDQVKAGLKMIVATMDDSYNIDVVIFPKSKAEDYSYKFGKLTKVTESVKYDIYRYVSGLKTFGCTPTRQVMNYVLDAPAYKDAGTIMFIGWSSY
jgi:tetratricopeptide (TPR) repeat protein